MDGEREIRGFLFIVEHQVYIEVESSRSLCSVRKKGWILIFLHLCASLRIPGWEKSNDYSDALGR